MLHVTHHIITCYVTDLDTGSYYDDINTKILDYKWVIKGCDKKKVAFFLSVQGVFCITILKNWVNT